MKYRYDPQDVELMTRTLALLEAKIPERAIWQDLDATTQQLLAEAPKGVTLTRSDALAARLWAMNKRIASPQLRREIAGDIAVMRNQIAGLEPTLAATRCEPLRTEGVMRLPPLLSPTQVREVNEFMHALGTERKGRLLYYSVPDVVRIPHLMAAALNPTVLEIASSYLGTEATIVDLATFESVAEGDEPDGAQIFHRDRDDFRFCKLFIYLTDVDALRGPHIFARGSHDPDELSRRLNITDPALIQGMFIQSGRHLQEHIAEIFGPDLDELAGPAGLSFLEDTYGFHRGSVPTAGNRIIFSAIYATLPYFLRVYRMSQAIGVFDPTGLTVSQRRAARLLIAPPSTII